MSYDVAVIGAGPGGYVAAIRAAQAGGNVCVIEKNELGGTCLNRGCIPSKALLHAAKVLSSVRKAEDFGIKGDVELDYAQLAKHKDIIIGRLNKGVAALLKNRKVTVIQGTGKLTGKREITVERDDAETVVEANKIIIATGSEVGRLPVFPFDGQHVITSDELLRWESLPSEIIIVGAGASGCEFASALSDFGVKVHLVELLDQVLPGLDSDVSKDLTRAFKKKGVQVRTGTKIDSISVENGKVKAVTGDETIEADVAMISTGRALNTQSLGLDDLNIEVDGSSIVINEHCQTSVPNIYAVGDNTGRSLLAHVASRQGIVAAEHAMGESTSMDYSLIPSCIYTAPEVASVGLTEAQASESSIEVKTAKYSFLGLGKSQVLGEGAGFVKIVGDEKTSQILGVQIVGYNATELIGEAAVAIRLEATVEELAETIHPHPTLSEAYMEAAEAFLGQPIHAMR
jgi:dihydrolipoamide dehydrogenase